MIVLFMLFPVAITLFLWFIRDALFSPAVIKTMSSIVKTIQIFQLGVLIVLSVLECLPHDDALCILIGLILFCGIQEEIFMTMEQTFLSFIKKEEKVGFQVKKVTDKWVSGYLIFEDSDFKCLIYFNGAPEELSGLKSYRIYVAFDRRMRMKDFFIY